MYDLQSQMTMSNIARDALDSIKTKQKETSKDLLQEAMDGIDYAKHVFEEYRENDFKLKIALEKHVYDVFVKECEEDQLASIQESVGNLLNTVNNIYKHVNIKPKLFGFQETDIELPKVDVINKSENIVMKHLNENYFNLSSLQRKNRYEESVTSYAKELVVAENIDTEDAIEHAYKSIVLEAFLKKLSIPSMIKSRIDDLLESDEYKAYCNQDELINLMESFNSQIHNLSRVFAVTI